MPVEVADAGSAAANGGAASAPAGGPEQRFGLQSTFAALSERHFRWLFAGNLAFLMAMQMQFILYGYLTFELTGSAKALGLISAVYGIQTLFVSPISGALVDRINKRLILAVSQGTAMAVSVIVAVLILTDALRYWQLVIIAPFIGLLTSINMPTRQAIVPQLVPRHKLMNAISLQMGGMNLTRIIAPALAGLLVAPLGAGWVYLVTALGFLAATAFEFHLPKHGLEGHPGTGRLTAEIAEGFAYIRRNPTLRLLLLVYLVTPMFAFPVQQMLPVFASDVFHRGAAGLGFMAAVSGIGGLCGTLFSANMDRQPAKGRLMLAGGLTMGVFYVLFALSPDFYVSLPMLAFAASGQMLFMTTASTVILADLPADIRGRVTAVMMMSNGVMPLGTIPVTVAADAFGAPAAIAFYSGILIATIVAIYRFSPRMRGLRLDALDRAELSPARAAEMVAEGTISESEAQERTQAPRLHGR